MDVIVIKKDINLDRTFILYLLNNNKKYCIINKIFFIKLIIIINFYF